MRYMSVCVQCDPADALVCSLSAPSERPLDNLSMSQEERKGTDPPPWCPLALEQVEVDEKSKTQMFDF